MLQIKLEVNGCLVDYVNIVNVTDLCIDRPEELNSAIYEVVYQGKKFGFIHNRSDGALVCALKGLQAITNNESSQMEQERKEM